MAFKEQCDIYTELSKAFVENPSQKFSRIVEETFNKIENPYIFLLTAVKFNREIYYTAGNSFTQKLVFEFEKILSKDTEGFFNKKLQTAHQKAAFQIAIQIKNKSLIDAFINCFQLSQNSDVIYPLLHNELDSLGCKKVCSLAIKLDLQSKFTVQDLLVPLFLDDNINLVEHFLDSSPSQREEFVSVLDKIVGKELTIEDLANKVGMPFTYKPRSNKIIMKLGLRLAKKYNIDFKVCPHMAKSQNLSGIKYLYYRRYIAKQVDADSFYHFLKDCVDNDASMKNEILDLFLEYCDPEGALPLLKMANFSNIELPIAIKDALNESSGDSLEEKINYMKIADEDLDFYPLQLPFSVIHFVNTVSAFKTAVQSILASNVIGIDCEWKASIQLESETEISLLQIATHTGVYLFDVLTLPQVLHDCHWESLGCVFSEKTIMKLVYAFHDDSKHISALHPVLENHLKNKANFVDLHNKKNILKNSYSNLFSFSSTSEKGLSELVFLCFGKPLNKRQQFSYWPARPLSKDQIIYAALDAYCLLDIVDYLKAMCDKYNLGDWNSLNNIPATYVHESRTSNKTEKQSNNSEACLAAKFKVVCDNMIQGLGKLLRHCNIDTVILKSNDHHHECIKHYEEESRVVLSRGSAYEMLRRYIPEKNIYDIKSDVSKNQLEEVVNAFNIIIEDSDVYGRCSECNSNEYLTVPSHIMKEIYDSNSSKEWINVDDGRSINVRHGITDTYTKIKIKEIQQPIFNKVKHFYVCNGCGKCYWDGSHFDKILCDTLSSVVKRCGSH